MQTLSVFSESLDEPATVVICPVGEVDAASASELRYHVDLALSSGCGPILIDCARLTFIDVAGMSVLVHLADAADLQGRLPILRDISPAFARLLRVTGFGDRFWIHHTDAAEAPPELASVLPFHAR